MASTILPYGNNSSAISIETNQVGQEIGDSQNVSSMKDKHEHLVNRNGQVLIGMK